MVEKEVISPYKYPEGNAGANYLIITIICFFLGLLMLFTAIAANSTGPMILIVIFIIIGIVFAVISKNNWGKPTSAGKYAYGKLLEQEELRKAQLEALKRGNVKVNLKGKMRKLK